MKVSLQWLADYVTLPPEDVLAEKLTMAGLEVEAIERPGEALRGVLVGQIMASTQHPNADKLSVTQVDTGASERLQIVCGAKNYKVGDKVPVATVGALLPNGVKIQQAQLRGVDSHGMLCSAKELGLAESSSGLLILEAATKVGAPIADVLGLNDTLFTLNVTPNRADALGHLGVAKDVVALTQSALNEPKITVAESGDSTESRVQVRIDAPDRCLRYAARVIEGIKVGPSPAWLRRRLEACGVRSINSIVDITNYVMFECGQPMHGFDLDLLSGHQIVVRMARAGEKMTTLDGKERVLDADDLLICDQEKAHGIAGVMGGAISEISDKTTNVMLESAVFLPAGIRRASKRHALHSEASHRFERGVDPERTLWALDRATQLILEIAGGTARKGRVDVYPKPIPRRTVTLRYAKVGQLLGVEVPEAESKRILEQLGFGVRNEAEGVAKVSVPSSRVDVEIEEDLIEEVARIRGYDTIPARLPTGGIALRPLSAQAQVEQRLRSVLSGLGFHEVLNYAFVSGPELEALGKKGSVTVKNPLSVEQSVMRTTLAAGLLQNVARNVRHQVTSGRLYEFGRVYSADPTPGGRDKPVAKEPSMAGGILWGNREARSWTAKETAIDFYDAKGAVESLLGGVGLTVSFLAEEGLPYHPRAAAKIVAENGAVLGSLGELHPRVAKTFDVPAGVFLFELNVDALILLAILKPTFEGLPKYPAVHRDLAVVVPQTLANEDVQRVLREVGGTLVEEATVFDVYTGSPVPEGMKNLAYALRYRAPDRTLTDIEVNDAHARIVREVNTQLGVSLRGSKTE